MNIIERPAPGPGVFDIFDLEGDVRRYPGICSVSSQGQGQGSMVAIPSRLRRTDIDPQDLYRVRLIAEMALEALL